MKIILLCCAIALMLLLISCTPANDTIKIGAVLPLTGEGTPDQGQASQRAITLAVEQLNARGGIYGKRVEVIFEDSQCQAEKGVTAIRKLITVNNVDFIIGDICDSVTAAIIPVAEQHQKILITPGSTSPAISDAGDYIFRFWFSENDLGSMAAQHAFDRGYRKMVILYINNAWGAAQWGGVADKFRQLGGEVVFEQVVNPEDNDYKTLILKSEEQHPDVYYIGLHPDGLVLAMKQMRERQIEKPVYSHGGLVGSTQTLGLGGDSLEGIVAPFVYDANATFRQKFVDRFGVEPGITADASYDAVVVVASIMSATGKTDSATIKDGLYDVKNYSGASGMISVDSKGDVHRPLRLMVVRGGALVPLIP